MNITTAQRAIATPLPQGDRPIEYEQLVEEISVDEIYLLAEELEKLLEAIEAAQTALSLGEPECEDIRNLTVKKAQKVKNRIKGLAIVMGVQQDFLAEYSQLLKRTGA